MICARIDREDQRGTLIIEALKKVACESIVEIAHHREVRDPNKAEFDKALDKIIQVTKDSVVVDRDQRYKRDETWGRPKK